MQIDFKIVTEKNSLNFCNSVTNPATSSIDLFLVFWTDCTQLIEGRRFSGKLYADAV